MRHVDKARGDLYAIADDLDFLKAQLARIPTRKELARMALMAGWARRGSRSGWIEVFWRQCL